MDQIEENVHSAYDNFFWGRPMMRKVMDKTLKAAEVS